MELSGDLDFQARPRLVAALDQLTGTARPDLLIDLRAVSFLDCSGLAILNRARLRTRQHGGLLRMVVTEPASCASFASPSWLPTSSRTAIS